MNLLKRFLLIPILALTAGQTTSAQTTISVKTSFAYESEYVFRGVQFADSSFQPSVEISYGSFYLGTWINSPIVDVDAQFLNEVDFYGGFGFDLGEKLSFDVGLTYYWFPEEPATDAQTRELYLGAAADIPLSPEVYFFYDFDLDTFTVEGAVGYSFTLGESVDSPLALDVGAYLAYVAPKVGPNGVYFGGSADISYALSPHTAFSLGVRASGISSEIGNDRTGNFWWGMSFSAGF